MRGETLALVAENRLDKGDVLGIARVAGIMAAKNASQLIPLCHPLPLDQVLVEFELDQVRGAVDITATARDDGEDGRRDGGAGGCQRRGAYRVRHVQEQRPHDAHRRRPPRPEERRQERRPGSSSHDSRGSWPFTLTPTLSRDGRGSYAKWSSPRVERVAVSDVGGVLDRLFGRGGRERPAGAQGDRRPRQSGQAVRGDAAQPGLPVRRPPGGRVGNRRVAAAQAVRAGGGPRRGRIGRAGQGRGLT